MKKQQTGSVLIIVLLIVVSMIALVSTMTINHRSAVLRSEQLDRYQQIRHDVDSATQLVQVILKKSLHGQPITSLDQPWLLAGTYYPPGHSLLQGQVHDMRRCYNINVLQTATGDESGKWPDEVERLVDLMVALDIERDQARQLTARLWDFIDSDVRPHRGGAEDITYLSKDKPYFSANQLLTDISELQFIEGMTKAVYDKLIPYLCVLPDEVLNFNINTVTKEHSVLLQVFSKQKLSKTVIHRWLESRPLGGWKSVEQALNSPILNELTKEDKADLSAYLRVDSDYFRFDGILTMDKTTYSWFTLLHWQDPKVTPVLQMEKQ